MSVAHFPTEQALASRLSGAGFRDVSWRRVSFGIAAIHVGSAS
jgi:ubiquinone/menaquinone biosynthesis C-methylase UbiE